MLSLRNQFIMAPVKLGYSDGTGVVTDKHLKFYEDRSFDAGAIALEPLYIHPGLREIPTQLGIASDEHVESLRTLVTGIHRSGAKVIAHLNHPGRLANPKIPGNYWVSSTDNACENGGATPSRLTKEQMGREIQLIVDAAERAHAAGFDIIELQMGHGYLPAQFLSPAVNDRDDEYGGSLENRMRFPLRVLDAVRDAVSLPIIVRISGDEMIPDGIHIEEMITLGGELKARGVAAVHVSAGTGCSTPPWFFQHMFVPKGKTWELARRFRDAVDIPVIYVGRVHSRADVERLQEEFSADYIAAGRALVADPRFFGKVASHAKGNAGAADRAADRAGNPLMEPIRPCLACAEGCLGGVKSGEGLTCVVNPEAGNCDDPLERAPATRHFAVVGGGLAGMQTSLTLTQRGHSVELFEQNELGGQFNLAHLPPHKESLKELVDFYRYEIERNRIPITMKDVSADELRSGGYDGVIVATGATPLIPPIPGLTEYWWAEALQEENLPTGKTILIIGGGLIGIEVAAKMIDADNRVIIVEMLDEVARGMEAIERTLSLKVLEKAGVRFYIKYKVTGVSGAQVSVESADGTTETIDGVDHIVLAAGMRSNHVLADALGADGSTPEVHLVGDAKQVGKAQTAIRDAYLTARAL